MAGVVDAMSAIHSNKHAVTAMNDNLSISYKNVNALKDSLGRPVDTEIRDAVAILNAIGFPTTDSCEGHLPGEEEGHYYPYVEICAPEPAGWEDNEAVEKQWRLENLKLQKHLLALLEEFYQDHMSNYSAQLTLRYIGAIGAFRIQSIGGEIMELSEPGELAETREQYRNELNRFITFLKNKYFPG